MQILSGYKVELVPLTMEHTQGLFEAGRYPEIWSFTQVKINTMEDAEVFVRKALELKNAMTYTIIEKVTKRIVGSTRLYDISDQNRSLEIGATWLTPSVWRSAVNTECKYLLLKHCFETLGTIRVQFKTDSRNTRSQHALERIGAVREGTLRNHMILPDGYIRDSVYFSIVDKEWPDVKLRLEQLTNMAISM